MEEAPVQVEWLILADAAKVLDNKLYLLGGGWDTLTVESGFPMQQHCAVAAAFRVPWNETNQPHTIHIEISTEDADTLAEVDGQIEAGRPPGLPRGQDQRVQLAFEMSMDIQQPGTYVITARVNGEVGSRVHFNVVPGPLLAMRQRRQQRGGSSP